tara:strand:+ start:1065 stop:2633 length:1569 start_codon:yes stop_codon:yes gene_type:complete
MKVRVIIPTAGLGKRLGNLTKNLNKSLITVAEKPAISHIIDSFPIDTEFVIPIGFDALKVREYLKIAYPKKKFFFIKIKKYSGKGSGLGLTMLKCKKYLERPFIFVSCDTIFFGKLPSLKNNWVGFNNSKISSSYRKIEIKNKKVLNFIEKKNNIKKSTKNYIGLAGIKDFKEFWKEMEKGKNKSIREGEVYGLKKLIKNQIKAFKFSWFDTGNIYQLKKAKEKLNKNNFNILEKNDESIFFTNDKHVIKFSNDKKFIQKRVVRQLFLKNYTPKIIKFSKHFYKYKKQNGVIFSKILTKKSFNQLLSFLMIFWKTKKVNKKNFQLNCLKFYKDKSLKRVKMFKSLYGQFDRIEKINGIKVNYVDRIMKEINWQKLSTGKPVNFHGDLHFENILKTKKKFLLLDWRQSFETYLDKGDLYYDLAKIFHGIIVSHQKVIDNKYNFIQKGNSTKITLKLSKKYKNIAKIFIKWIEKNKFDLHKVTTLTALIYLNIAPLHHYPYSIFLFKLGKLMLTDEKFVKKMIN